MRRQPCLMGFSGAPSSTLLQPHPASRSLAKCNEEVMECAGGLCAFYADLNACCNGAGKCGNMEGQEQLLATACRGTVTS